MSISIGVVAVAMTAVVAAPFSTVSPDIELSADSTALIVCGTTCPTPDELWVESVKNQFIAATHPGEDIDYVAVTTPQEFWPITGVLRLVGTALGPATVWGPGGPGWPDEPWWKLSGLFDRTADQSLSAGADDLEAAMAAHGNDNLVISGYSQGAGVANVVKRRLAERYPHGTEAPDIDFVLVGDPNLPNGGLMSRFPGLHIPFLDMTFNGPALTDTQFDTVEINRQYDGFTDFPLYPINLIADLNAILGILYLHTYPFDVSLPADPTSSPAYQGTHGDTSYYFFETENLPLFAPLRALGVPESLIDVVEPFFRVLVELGYDRSIPPWEPTPARLIPTVNPVTVIGDLVAAVGEGIDNATSAVQVADQVTVQDGPPQSRPTSTEAPAETAEVTEPADETTTSTTTVTDTATDSEADREVAHDTTGATRRDSLRDEQQPATKADSDEGARDERSSTESSTDSSSADSSPSDGSSDSDSSDSDGDQASRSS